MIIGRYLLVQRLVKLAQHERAIGFILHQFLEAIELEPTDTLAGQHLIGDILEECLILGIAMRTFLILLARQILLGLPRSRMPYERRTLHQTLATGKRIKIAARLVFSAAHIGGLVLHRRLLLLVLCA